jgi:hypothetical protein
VKVKHPERSREHFEQLKKDFASLGIILDPSKGGNPTDPRFYSYDPNAYLAPEFRVYDRVGGSEIYAQTNHATTPQNHTTTWNGVADAVAEIVQRGLDIAPDYATYMKIGMALSREFGEAGREFFHAVCRPSPKYKPKDADHQFTACIRAKGGGISIGTFFYHFLRATKP